MVLSKKIMSFTVMAALAGAVLPFGAVQADHVETYSYKGNLRTLNASKTRGDVAVEVIGDQATVKLTTTGASPGLPHAQHFHIGGENMCPSPSADADNDGFISTVEGQPSYGGIRVSLTTSGDVSSASGLAVDRFPIADSNGVVNYERTFTLPEGVTGEDLRSAVVVQHGISDLFGDETQYDGEKRSTVDDGLPFEATVPSACGELKADADQRVRNADQRRGERREAREMRREDRRQAREEKRETREMRRQELTSQTNGSDGSDFEAVIRNTGPNSDNSISFRNWTDFSARNTNDIGVDFDTDQDATSGDASVNRNTRSGNADSGEASNNNDANLSIEISQ